MAALREVSELLYPAVYATVMSLGIDPKDGGQDAGMAKAALILARTIDEADDKDRRHALRDCMPELRQILESLGGSPAARAAIAKGAGKDKGPARVSKLDTLRAASIHKPA